MSSFKVECEIEDEKGKRTETIFVKDVDTDEESEQCAKYHFINKGVVFYAAKSTKI